MVVSEVALVRGKGHGVDSGEKLQEARLRRTMGEPHRLQQSKVSQRPVVLGKEPVFTFRVQVQGVRTSTSKLRFCALCLFSCSRSLGRPADASHPPGEPFPACYRPL
jgi:hypothetical protein